MSYFCFYFCQKMEFRTYLFILIHPLINSKSNELQQSRGGGGAMEQINAFTRRGKLRRSRDRRDWAPLLRNMSLPVAR